MLVDVSDDIGDTRRIGCGHNSNQYLVMLLGHKKGLEDAVNDISVCRAWAWADGNVA